MWQKEVQRKAQFRKEKEPMKKKNLPEDRKGGAKDKYEILGEHKLKEKKSEKKRDGKRGKEKVAYLHSIFFSHSLNDQSKFLISV